MQTQNYSSSNETTVDQLNSFLRGELSAAETYRMAIERLDGTPHHQTLVQCCRSHEERARLLGEAIRGLGGVPADGSGAWGSLVLLLARGAAAVSERTAIALLEEGEDHGRDDYLRDVENLEPTTRNLVESSIMPEQQRTHASIKAVKAAMS